ncbi:unnamed protein product [Caenorhabditis brenneri]
MKDTKDLTAQKKFLVRRFAAGDDYRAAYEALRKEFRGKRLIKIEDGFKILNEFKARKEAKESNGNERRLRRSTRRGASSDLVVPENDSLFEVPSDSASQKTFLKEFFENGRSFATAYDKLQKLFPRDVLPKKECQNFYRELQKPKDISESPAKQPRQDQPEVADGSGVEERIMMRGMNLYEIPIDSILEDIEDYFLDQEAGIDAMSLHIQISPSRIILHQNREAFLKFSKNIIDTCFVERRGVKELHQSNYVELCLSTILSLLRSKKLGITILIIKKCEAYWEESNNSTWLEFLKLFNRLKYEIFNLSPLILMLFNKREDYRQLEALNLNIIGYFGDVETEAGVSHFTNIDEAENCAHDNFTTVENQSIFVTAPAENTPRIVMENPARMILH